VWASEIAADGPGAPGWRGRGVGRRIVDQDLRCGRSRSQVSLGRDINSPRNETRRNSAQRSGCRSLEEYSLGLFQKCISNTFVTDANAGRYTDYSDGDCLALASQHTFSTVKDQTTLIVWRWASGTRDKCSCPEWQNPVAGRGQAGAARRRHPSGKGGG
jgi:hypothetical protein